MTFTKQQLNIAMGAIVFTAIAFVVVISYFHKRQQTTLEDIEMLKQMLQSSGDNPDLLISSDGTPILSDIGSNISSDIHKIVE